MAMVLLALPVQQEHRQMEVIPVTAVIIMHPVLLALLVRQEVQEVPHRFQQCF